MPADLDLIVPATTRGLHQALQALEETCPAHGVSLDILSRARIVIEELFTNTIKYGYGGECDRPVRVAVSVGTALTIILEDDGPAFDPTLWKASKELPSERPVGQAGIALVVGLSSKFDYLRLPNANRMTIVIAPR